MACTLLHIQTTYNPKASRHHLQKNNGGSGSTVLAYKPIILSVSTYSSFGAPLEDGSTNWSNESYRYGFNGMEKDDELKGDGNSYDFGARIYDARLGRFLSIDPLISIQAFSSGYSFTRNSPIYLIDINGLLGDVYLVVIDKNGNKTKTKIGTHDMTQKKWETYFSLGLPGTIIGEEREFDYDITITINLTEKGFGVLYGTENFTDVEERTESRVKHF